MMNGADLQDKWVIAAGLRTRYWDVGDGPSVVLLHGIGAHAGFWRAAIPGLSRDFRIVVPDLCGSGRSEAPRTLSREVFGGWLAAFIKEVGASPAAVVGNSMGGAFALAAALDHPGTVACLVLVDSSSLGKGVSLTFRMLTIPVLGELILPPEPAAIRRGILSMTYKKDWLWDGLVEETTELARLPGANEFFFRTLRWGVSFFGGLRPQVVVVNELARLQMPVLLIWGAQDKVFPLGYAIRGARLISNSELKVIDACGHMPQMERPAEFNRALLEFLAKHRDKLGQAGMTAGRPDSP